MSKYVYSAKSNAFYPTSMKETYAEAGLWPDDGKPCEEELFAQFAGTPPEGKVRVAGDDGYPAWTDIPPPTAEEIKRDADYKKSELLAQATIVIAPLQDAVDLDMATEEEAAALLAWKKYRVLLNRVDTSNPVWPKAPKS